MALTPTLISNKVKLLLITNGLDLSHVPFIDDSDSWKAIGCPAVRDDVLSPSARCLFKHLLPNFTLFQERLSHLLATEPDLLSDLVSLAESDIIDSVKVKIQDSGEEIRFIGWRQLKSLPHDELLDLVYSVLSSLLIMDISSYEFKTGSIARALCLCKKSSIEEIVYWSTVRNLNKYIQLPAITPYSMVFDTFNCSELLVNSCLEEIIGSDFITAKNIHLKFSTLFNQPEVRCINDIVTNNLNITNGIISCSHPILHRILLSDSHDINALCSAVYGRYVKKKILVELRSLFAAIQLEHQRFLLTRNHDDTDTTSDPSAMRVVVTYNLQEFMNMILRSLFPNDETFEGYSMDAISTLMTHDLIKCVVVYMVDHNFTFVATSFFIECPVFSQSVDLSVFNWMSLFALPNSGLYSAFPDIAFLHVGMLNAKSCLDGLNSFGDAIDQTVVPSLFINAKAAMKALITDDINKLVFANKIKFVDGETFAHFETMFKHIFLLFGDDYDAHAMKCSTATLPTRVFSWCSPMSSMLVNGNKLAILAAHQISDHLFNSLKHQSSLKDGAFGLRYPVIYDYFDSDVHARINKLSSLFLKTLADTEFHPNMDEQIMCFSYQEKAVSKLFIDFLEFFVSDYFDNQYELPDHLVTDLAKLCYHATNLCSYVGYSAQSLFTNAFYLLMHGFDVDEYFVDGTFKTNLCTPSTQVISGFGHFIMLIRSNRHAYLTSSMQLFITEFIAEHNLHV